MKKIYATLLLSSLIFSANAQQGIRKAGKVTESAVNIAKQGNQSTQVLVCDTLTTLGATDTLRVYTAQGGGYVAGNNSYGDKTKATFLPGAMIQPASTITGVIAQFYRDAINNRGTAGTGAITMEIIGGDTTTGPAGAALGSSPTTLAAVISGGTQVGPSLIYLFPFGTAVNAPATGFFSSLTLPTASTDTAVLFLADLDPALPKHNYAWEKWSDNTFHSFGDPNNWDLPTSLSLYPIVCYNSTGIHSNALEAGFGMYPNPSNGQLNFAVSLVEATNLNVSITNALGQVVFTATEKNVRGGVFNYDLTSLGKGIYFATVTDSNNNQVVRKVVIE
jgi:hypothetical protein